MTTTKPAILPVNEDAIPATLKQLNRWLVWNWEQKGNKWDKPPLNVRTGELASSTNAETWTTFTEAVNAHQDGRFDGIGFVLGHDPEAGVTFSGFDFDDCRDPVTGEIAPWAIHLVRVLSTYTEISPSGEGLKCFTIGTLPKGKRADHDKGVECYDGGRYFTVTGSHFADTPTEVFDRTEELALVHKHTLGQQQNQPNRDAELSDRELALDALKGLSAHRAEGYFDWLAVGMALHSVDPGLCSSWDQWSRSSAKYTDGACERKWKSFGNAQSNGIGLGSLIHWAKQDGWKPPKREKTKTHSVKVREGFHNRTDSGNAELFARLYGDRVRFDHARNRWLLWGEHWWKDDGDAEIIRLAKDAARHRYLEAVNISDRSEREAEASWAITSESRAKIDATLALARAERPIADSGKRWDANPWLFAAANGVIDLQTGTRRSGCQSDRITMQSPINFQPGAKCTKFEKSLKQIFADNAALIAFVQRAVGYSLTGITTEQCLFMGHGGGSNGKTTFLTAVGRALGDYGYNMPFSTIEFQRQAAIPNDLAALVGRRFVTASEANESSRLNEARVKALTGCDPITARFLHGEFFTFRPVAKFWIAVNHKPRVSDTSFGFWRRVRLIPFTVQFSGDAVDKGLENALAEEAPGILAWAVRGCLAWQKEGLNPPDEVTSATAEYQQESDPLRDFIAERCVEGQHGAVKGSDFYKTYKAWADEQGLSERERLSSTAFGKRASDRFNKKRDGDGVWYEGVALKGM